jgi:hypothetical protein
MINAAAIIDAEIMMARSNSRMIGFPLRFIC